MRPTDLPPGKVGFLMSHFISSIPKANTSPEYLLPRDSRPHHPSHLVPPASINAIPIRPNLFLLPRLRNILRMPHQQRPNPPQTRQHQMRHPRRHLLHTRPTPLPDPKSIVEKHRTKDIEPNICKADSIVPPPITPADRDPGQKLVGTAERTVFASCGGGGVEERSGGVGGEVGLEVGAAGGAEGRVEAAEFGGGADYGAAVHAGCCEAGHEVG